MSSSDRNETVHDHRRVSEPDRGPDATGRSRGRLVALIALAAVASLAAGYVAASLVSGSDSTPPLAGSTTVRSATAPRVPAGTLSPSTPVAPPPVAGATPPATPPAAPPTATAGSFDAPIPRGWREREFAVQREGYLQSRWSDPRDPRTYVIINWIDGDRRQPSEAATALRAGFATRADYREVRFARAGARGWVWVYTILDEQRSRAARVDLISRRCGVLFAVLGSTTTKRFHRLQPTFVAISRGIRIKSRSC
jgi:hypothetical protein